MQWRPGSRFLLRLTLSYAAVAFTTIALIGIGIFWAFLNRYNDEIEALELKLVEHTADAIHSAYLEPARTIYFQLSSDELTREELSFFVANEVAGNHYRIIGVHRLLQEALEPYGAALESVAVHYRDNRLSISSRAGVKFGVDDPLYERLESSGSEVRREALRGMWRMDGDRLEYVRQYPFTVAATAPALMTVAVPYERVMATIADLSNESTRMFVTDASGEILTPRSYLTIPTDADQASIAPLLTDAGSSTVVELPSGSHILTTMPIEGTSWHLAKLTEVTAFYERSRATRNVMLIITVSALSVCIFLSVVLARNQYEPVARIARMVTGMVSADGAPASRPTDVDFGEMVKGLTRLSGEVDELRRSVAANRPIMRHQLVQSCLYGNIRGEAELSRRLRLLDVTMPVSSSRVLLLRLHRKQLATYELEERSAIIYHLIDRVAGFQSTHIAMASELGEDRLGILVLGSGATGADGITLARSLSDYLTTQFGVVHRIGIGRATGSPETCYVSYHEAMEAVAAGFYLARQTILFDDLVAAPDAGASGPEVPYEHRKQLVDALHDRDRKLVDRAIGDLTRTLSSGRYPARSCRLALSACISDVTTYAERIGHTLLPSEHRRLQAFEEEFVDIDEWSVWIRELIATIFGSVEDSVRDARLIRMRRVQDYIHEHLNDPISLDSVAEEFNITPSTLSRDFKNLNGVSFVDFVRESRLDHAERLLRTGDLSVKEVAERSGYNSSSYFIQQFRRRFGVTPSQYRDNAVVSNGV